MPLAIFDIDGTLCDTFDVDDECFCQAVEEALSVPVPVSSWESAIHITDSGVVDWLWRQHRKRPPTASELEMFAQSYARNLSRELERSPDRFRVVTGAPELLERLQAMQWNVAIATGGWRRLARLKLAAARISRDLLLATSDDSMDRHEIFRLAQLRAVERSGEPHSDVVLVGDGVWDVRVAAAHRWRFLGVGKGERAERLWAAGATVVVEHFGNLPETLSALETLEIGVCPRISP